MKNQKRRQQQAGKNSQGKQSRTRAAAAPPPAGNDAAADPLRTALPLPEPDPAPAWDVENEVHNASAIVAMLGDALSGFYQFTGRAHGGSLASGVSLLACDLADDLEVNWDAAREDALKGKPAWWIKKDGDGPDAAERLATNVIESAAFTHAACQTLAAGTCSEAGGLWERLGPAYLELGHRLAKQLLDSVPVVAPTSYRVMVATCQAEAEKASAGVAA